MTILTLQLIQEERKYLYDHSYSPANSRRAFVMTEKLLTGKLNLNTNKQTKLLLDNVMRRNLLWYSIYENVYLAHEDFTTFSGMQISRQPPML